MRRGIWINDTTFHNFAEPNSQSGLADHIATRARAGDFSSFLGLLPNPDPVLKRMGRDIKVYGELASDAHVKGCIRRRRGAVKSMERGFDRMMAKSGNSGRGQAGARVVKNLESIYADLPISEFIGQSIDGALYGYSVFEVLWGQVGGLRVPVDLVAKPAAWFGYDNDNQLRFRSRGNVLTGELLPERKFLVVRNGATYENPYGEPDLASVFWPTTFKRGGLKFWVTFTEKYGTPWAVGKQPRSATPADASQLLDKLDSMVQDAVAVIPDDSSVELLTVNSGANADLYERLLHFCRSEVSIALLGNNQSIEATANLASAKAAQEVEAALRDADAEVAATALTTLARWVVDVNWGEGAAAPAYALWEQEEVDDALAKRDETLTKAGVKFTRQYFKDAYNLDDAHLQADQAAPGQASGNDPVTDPSFAEGDDALPADQVALDAAIDQLPAEALNQAMRTLLKPALDAIAAGKGYDQVQTDLVAAYPQMDASELEQLMTRAFFVADLWGAGNARND